MSHDPLLVGTCVEMKWDTWNPPRIGRIVEVFPPGSPPSVSFPGKWLYRIDLGKDPFGKDVEWIGPEILQGRRMFSVRPSNWFYETIREIEPF